jgi:tetratricopeptide (TPR) repeat protein
MCWNRQRKAGRAGFLPNFRRWLSQLAVSVAILLAVLGATPVWASPVAHNSPQPQAFQIGVMALERGDYQGAIAQFTQAIRAGSQVAAALSNRCLARLQLEDYSHAVSDCTKALELNPDQVEAYLNRGLAFDRTGDFKQAIANYDQLLQRRPDDFRAYYNRGLAQFELGAYQAAIADYERSIQQPGLDRTALADIYSDRGLAKLMLSDGVGAIADFSEAIHLNETNTRAYYNRACAYHRQGNLELAVNDFTHVLAQVPNHAEAYRSRGLIRYQLGEKQQAIADLRQATQHFSSQGAAIAAQQTLSWIQRLQLSVVALG